MEDWNLDDLDATDLEELRKRIEAEQLKRSNRKAVALEAKRRVEDLAQQFPEVFAEPFTDGGVEGCQYCLHVSIGEPDREHDPHLKAEDA